MKLAVCLILGLWTLFTFSGCSQMLESLRSESAAIDEEVDRDREEGQGEIYGYKPKVLKGVSANNVSRYEPPVQRNYGRRLASLSAEGDGASSAPEISGRRMTRADFVDQEAKENSLWDAQGQNNYLFSHNRRREAGDLVTVDIEKELRREIQYQLWMTLPPELRRTKRAPASEGDAVKNVASSQNADPNAPDAKKDDPNKPAEEKAKDAAEEAAKSNLALNGKDDDTVRMEVVETLGNGLVRMVGQKRVIYKGATRVIEVMALVNNKDIDDNNKSKSSTLLDTQTQVVQ
jgi:flagellar basal body L-ring protein FlgH